MSRYKDKDKLKERQQQAYTFFIEKGYTPVQSAGIVGNLIQESRLDPGVKSAMKDENSFGIAQWNPSPKSGNRLGQLKKFAANKGTDHFDFTTQLEFIHHELETSKFLGKSKLMEAKNVREASEVFSKYYERPSKKYAHNDKRANYAKAIFLANNDKETYSKNSRGEIVVLNPDVVTEEDKKKSPAIKQEFYHKTYNVPLEVLQVDAPPAVREAKQELQQNQKEVEFKNELIKGLSSLNKTPGADTPPVPRQFNFETQDIRVQDNEFYSQVLPEGADGLTVTDPGKKKPIIKDERGQNTKPTESTETGFPGFKFNPDKKKVNWVMPEDGQVEILPQQLDEVVITASKSAIEARKQREAELANAKVLETAYVDTRYQDGIKEKLTDEGDVKKVQEFLVSKGYDLNPYGTFKNNGIDGKKGKVTSSAIEQYNASKPQEQFYTPSKKTPEEGALDKKWGKLAEGVSNTFGAMGVERGLFGTEANKGFLGQCSETQCSEYVQNEVFRNVATGKYGYGDADRAQWNKTVGITGDAWELGDNIVKAGGKKVPLGQIQPGDVVGIAGTSSEGAFYDEARAKGKNYTHAGVVDEVNPDGSYWVLHNFHKVENNEFVGQEYRTLVKPDNGNKLKGYVASNVEEAFRPNYSGKPKKDKVIARPDVQLVQKENGYTKPEAKAFLSSINNVETKNKFMNRYDVDEEEFYSLAKSAMGIFGQETNFGTDIRYSTGAKKAGASIAKALTGTPVEDILGTKKDEVSLGPGSVKVKTNFNGADLSLFGVTEGNITDPEKATIVTMQKLAEDYKYFINKGLDKQEAIYRAIQKYNGSLKTVSKGKTREEWAKDYDLDYPNKIINFASDFDVVNQNGEKAKTLIDELSTKENVLKWVNQVKQKKEETPMKQVTGAIFGK